MYSSRKAGKRLRKIADFCHVKLGKGERLGNEDNPHKHNLDGYKPKSSRISTFGLYESLMTNDITQDEYRELKAGYEAKITDLTDSEKDLRNKLVECIAKGIILTNTTEHPNGVQQLSDLTTESLDRLVEKILVFEDIHIEVQFKAVLQSYERLNKSNNAILFLSL